MMATEARTIEVTITETLTVLKTVLVHLEPEFDFDPLERDDDALCEIEQRARAIAYADLATKSESSWDLIGSDGPQFEIGKCE